MSQDKVQMKCFLLFDSPHTKAFRQEKRQYLHMAGFELFSCICSFAAKQTGALQTAVLGRNDGLDVRSSLFRAPDGVGIEDCVLGQDYVHALELPMVLEVMED
jgi:hypothetical protein